MDIKLFKNSNIFVDNVNILTAKIFEIELSIDFIDKHIIKKSYVDLSKVYKIMLSIKRFNNIDNISLHIIGKHAYLAEGNHRFIAYKKLNKQTIKAQILFMNNSEFCNNIIKEIYKC